MNPLGMIDDMILQIVTLKGPQLMIAFLILTGYGLKIFPWFPNDLIPLVTIAFGGALAPLFIAWPSTGSMDPALRYPEVTAWAQIMITGLLLGAGAWLIHNKVLKPFIDDKISPPSHTPEPGKDTPTP
jgi:hypothetical protein